MGNLVQKYMKQTAVYWAPTGQDGYGGFTWATPVDVLCRWTDLIQVISDAMGKEIISKAWLLRDQPLLKDGMVWLGNLASLSAAQKANPRLLSDAYMINGVNAIPSRNVRFTVYKIFLGEKK